MVWKSVLKREILTDALLIFSANTKTHKQK